MKASFAQPQLPTPLLVADGRAKTAKATLRKTDNGHEDLGGCLEEVRRVFGLSLEEFAYELGKDARQVARQIKGDERPQLEVVFAVERFRPALVIALARLAHGVEIDTVIHIRRSA